MPARSNPAQALQLHRLLLVLDLSWPAAVRA
jgi:hypothetical protein